MSSFDPTRVLFAGRALLPHSLWYRCAQPAMQLGADWCAIAGDPGAVEFGAGVARRPLALASFADYDAVVLQAAERSFIPVIEGLQAAGTTVLYELDGDLRDVRVLREHPVAFIRSLWDPERLAGMEAAMAACDGVIVPTRHLARRVAEVNPRVWVCRNGIDAGRYALTPMPGREQVTIGWSGWVGHNDAVLPWLPVVAKIMRERPHVRFHSVGVPFADAFAQEFGDRALALPWNDPVTFPSSTVDFDVALAPAGRGAWYRAKSDLRWLEASMLGIPTVADPYVYAEIEDGVTGFHAPDTVVLERVLSALVDDAELRRRVGAAAKEHVLDRRTIAVTADDWAVALSQCAAGVKEAA